MPASNNGSFWERIFGWLRRPSNTATPSTPVTPSTPTMPSTPVTPTPVTPTPSTPVTPPTTPTEPQAPVTPVTPPLVSTTLPTEGAHLDFTKLWRNHPAIADEDVFPCKDVDGNPNFGNQCGIMMGVCLLRSGLLHGYDKSVCWYRGHQGHTLRAREVADWMRSHPERFGRVEIRSNVTWGAFKGRTGFVCFQNFWGEGNQGDHIDLWDGTGLVRKALDSSLEGAGMAHGSLDYFERSEEVWFWPVY